MLPPQRVYKVTFEHIISEARMAHVGGALSACAVSRASPSHTGRFTHAKKLRSADDLHSRFGVTDPAVFRALATSALGVESFAAPHARITSLAFVQQASRRTAIRKAKVERERPLPGTSASLDFTREFARDVDGNIVAAVFLDIATYSLFVFPLPGKSGLDAAKAVRAYREHVRERYAGVELSNLRSDSDPSFSANSRDIGAAASELRRSLEAELPHVQMSFSPPHCQAMNPVEGDGAPHAPAQFLSRSGLLVHAGVGGHSRGQCVRSQLPTALTIVLRAIAVKIARRVGHGYQAGLVKAHCCARTTRCSSHPRCQVQLT
jgi:hypothetical protein